MKFHFFFPLLLISFFSHNALAFSISHLGPLRIERVEVATDAQPSDTEPAVAAPADSNLLFSKREEPVESMKGKCSNGTAFLVIQTPKGWQGEKPKFVSPNSSMALSDFAKLMVCEEQPVSSVVR